jgi:two-component system OmpR family response regulator
MNQQVLLIDDEQDFCQLMRGQMTRRHFDFECAHTLREGMEKVEVTHPDILFLDNNLPDGRGWQEAVKLQKAYPNMRIILISALNQPGFEETGIGLQFTRVSKPVSFRELETYLA